MPRFTINVSVEGYYTLVVEAPSIDKVEQVMKIEKDINRLYGWPIWNDVEISYQVSHGAAAHYDAAGSVQDDFIDF